MIQDYIISVCLGFLVGSLTPSIFSPNKPSKYTSVVQASALVVIGICMFSLKLWFSAGMNWLGTIGWTILLLQKIRQEKHGR